MRSLYINLVAIVHFCSTFLIISGLRKKPLGMQTLVDLVMSNTLVTQSIDIFGHVFILNWSVFASLPMNDIICIIFTICISLLALFHTFFLMLTVLTKFVCVYYSSFQELLEDGKLIRAMWTFVFIASTILVFAEFFFIHDIQSMNTYNALKVSKTHLFLIVFYLGSLLLLKLTDFYKLWWYNFATLKD